MPNTPVYGLGGQVIVNTGSTFNKDGERTYVRGDGTNEGDSWFVAGTDGTGRTLEYWQVVKGREVLIAKFNKTGFQSRGLRTGLQTLNIGDVFSIGGMGNRLGFFNHKTNNAHIAVAGQLSGNGYNVAPTVALPNTDKFGTAVEVALTIPDSPTNIALPVSIIADSADAYILGIKMNLKSALLVNETITLQVRFDDADGLMFFEHIIDGPLSAGDIEHSFLTDEGSTAPGRNSAGQTNYFTISSSQAGMELDGNTSGEPNINMWIVPYTVNDILVNNDPGQESTGLSIGVGSTSLLAGDTAVGWNSTATGGFSVAVGGATVSTGIESVAIGHEATASANNSVAIGGGGLVAAAALATASNGIALGLESYSNGINSQALGPYSLAFATGSLAVGHNAASSNTSSVAVGASSSALGVQAVAIGFSSLAEGADSIAIGNDADSPGADSIAIGHSSTGLNANGIAIGELANAEGIGSISTGLSSFSAGNGSIAIGVSSSASSEGAVAMGESANAPQGSVALGKAALSAAIGVNNTAIGYGAGNTVTTGYDNVLVGKNSQPSTGTSIGQFVLGSAQTLILRCNTQTIVSLSDGRDKTDVQDSTLGLEYINALRPVNFLWETRDGNSKDGTREVGFIAQELQATSEQLEGQDLHTVLVDNPDRLEADYGRLLPVAIKAIQELSAKVDSLQSEINILKGS